MTSKKDGRKNNGGARRTVDPIKGKAKPYQVSLYENDRDFIVEKHGSLTKGIKTLLPKKNTIPHPKKSKK